MTKLVVFREERWFEEATEYRMWEHLSRAYGVDLVMLPRNGELPEIGGTVVLVDEDADKEVGEFNHPEDAVYVIGRSNQRLIPGREKFQSVRIDTPHPVSMFGISAAAIVLDDRRKLWQSQ